MVALDFAPSNRKSRRRCRYQSQNSWQTLAEGLAEYYAVNRGRVKAPDALPPESAALFRNHDICHVIFGLDTTLADETMADARTLLSCDVGWRRYARYLAADVEAKRLFRSIGHAKAAWITVLALPRMFRALIESWRMAKRWPWSPPEDLLDRKLSELREEYRIRVI